MYVSLWQTKRQPGVTRRWSSVNFYLGAPLNAPPSLSAYDFRVTKGMHVAVDLVISGMVGCRIGRRLCLLALALGIALG